MKGQEQAPCLPLIIAVTSTYPSDHRRPHTAGDDLAALVIGPVLTGMSGTAAQLMSLPRRHYWPCDLARIWAGRWAQVPRHVTAPPRLRTGDSTSQLRDGLFPSGTPKYCWSQMSLFSGTALTNHARSHAAQILSISGTGCSNSLFEACLSVV